MSIQQQDATNSVPNAETEDRLFIDLPSKVEEDMGKLDLYNPALQSRKIDQHKVIYQNIKKNMP